MPILLSHFFNDRLSGSGSVFTEMILKDKFNYSP